MAASTLLRPTKQLIQTEKKGDRASGFGHLFHLAAGTLLSVIERYEVNFGRIVRIFASA
jgi:hypothetical protein